MPRAPLRTLVALALPMVIARATQSVVTFADAFQVKHLGLGAIAATATGGLNVIGVVILPMGTVFIVQSFVSQLTGRGESAATPRFALYGLALAAIAGVLAAAAIPLVGPILGLTGYSPAVRADMTDYMSIRLLSVGAVVGVEALGNWYGGLGNTWMQMVSGAITMVVAVFGNWVLIGGHLGAPALGVAGAAWACVIASWAGFAFIAVAFHRRWGAGDATGSATRGLSWRELRRVARFGLPNGINWFLEFAAFQLFVNVVIAGLGDATVAAFNVVLAINSIAFMPAFGLASAGAILAGQAIGGGRRDDVWPQVKVTLACTATWMGLIGSIYLIAPSALLTLFTVPGVPAGALVAVGTTMLIMSSLWQLFDAVQMTLAETLRAAGDTAWIAGARIVLAWAVFTPAAYLAVRVGDTGAVGAMACLAGYLVLLAVVLALRFRSGAWRRIEMIEREVPI